MDQPMLAAGSSSASDPTEIPQAVLPNGYPEPTTWHVTCNMCCCAPCLETETDPPQSFWGHWEVRPGMLIFVSILSMIPFAVFFAITFPKLSQGLQIASGITVGITGILFMSSYFAAACMDPGFLPFDWVKTRKFKYTWREQLSGLAVRNDQIEFAKANRPAYASFSKSAGRFVVRADHICAWIGQWVAKRNHKQFLLMNFWGGVFALMMVIWTLFVSKRMISGSIYVTIFGLFGFGIELTFGITMLYVFGVGMNDLRRNVTTIQKWKTLNGQEAPEKYSWIHGMREVCGQGTMACWLCPCPAFGDDLMIIEGDLPPEPCNYE
jgi:hypothetical protein